MILGRMVSKIDRCTPGKVAWYSERVSVRYLKSIMTEGSYLKNGLTPTNG